MKALFITPALICTVLFAFNAQAAGDAHAKDAAHGGGHAKGAAHRDNNALFPQPKADVAAKGTAPGATELVSPAFQSKVAGPVTLTWKAVEGADTYHVQVATDPAFRWRKADQHGVSGTSFEVKDLEKGKTYYWRVAAWKNANIAATNKGPFTPSIFTLE